MIPQRFGAKKRLWYAAVDHGFSQIYRDLEREAESLGSDDLVVLRGLMARAIEVTASHPSVLRIINQEASIAGPRFDYLFDTYIKPARDFGEDWLAKLESQGRIKNTSVTLLYFLMSHGGGGLFAMPALASSLMDTDRLLKGADIRVQAEMVVDIIFEGIQA